MGCDGGTIPRRDELVKLKKKPEAKDKIAELNFQWQHCTITQEVLEKPIVACGMGRLYSKSSLIEALLSRSLPECSKHIKSLKDVKDLKLTPNPEYDSNAEKTEGMLDCRAAPYICPIIKIEMSGKHKFVFLWNCGCVFSERALKEIKTSVCHNCQSPFVEKDVVILNGTEEDMEIMQANVEERQALQKAKKKSKHIVKQEIKTEPNEVIVTPSTSEKKRNETNTSVIKESQSSKIKRINGESSLLDPDIKKIKMNYSVAKDPTVTDVYKSIFTSHKSEKEQTRAHWVTYNPFYN